MSDPRRLVVHHERGEQHDRALAVIARHLAAAIAGASRKLKISNASVVMVGIDRWTWEMAALDASATADMLRGLADIYDPAVPTDRKLAAEARRHGAVVRIFAAIDMAAVKPEGHA